jgi:hypothetical protein
MASRGSRIGARERGTLSIKYAVSARSQPMDLTLTAVAEHLAEEFPDQPTTTVVRVVTDCVEEFPNSDPMFVEQAARARLTGV